MEENSMVFSVDSGEVSEDEDELQRREELHQLLSEQLQDDLLEDSISTATSLYLSPTPPHQHSNPSTPPHQHSNPSTPPHQHSNTSTPPYQHTDPSTPPYQHTDPSTPPHQHTDPSTPPHQHSNTPIQAGSIEIDNASTDMRTAPPVELASTDSCASHVIFPPEGDAGTLPLTEDHTHTSPQGVGHRLTPPSSTVGCGFAEGQTHEAGEEREREAWGQADVFSGTSQSYGGSGIGREAARVHAPPTPEYSAQQLEILYHARGRRIEMLSQQVSAQAAEGERHIRILRHEKGLLVEERDRLTQQVAGLEGLQQSLDGEVAALRGQLGAEQSRSQALEGSQRELVSQLQAAEASVESLTCQVSELTRTDAVTRVRESFTSALAQSSHQHQQHTLTLQHQLESTQAEIERQNEAILRLQSQQLQPRALPPVCEESQSGERSGERSEDPLAQQLLFGNTEEEAGLGEGSLMERVVELSARVEDLQFQLSTAEGALAETRERAGQAEAQVTSQAAEVAALAAENQQLSLQLEDALRQEEERRVLAEEDKRDALEKCRTACLQLHEDATQRLRGAAAEERERARQEHAKQLSQIKAELAGVQEQYVLVCGEKEMLCQQLEGRGEGVPREWEGEKTAAIVTAVQKARSQWLAQQKAAVAQAVGTARGKWVGQQEEAVRAAVEAARGAWQQRLLEESKASVEQALGAWQKEAELQLAKARQQWEQEHEAAVKKVREECGGEEAIQAAVLRAKQRWEGEREAAVTQAVRGARSQWLREREAGLGGRVEAAVAAAQQLWRAQQREELEQKRAGLERAHTAELEQQRAGLERAHTAELEQQRAGLERAHEAELEQQRAGLERAHTAELEQQRAGLERANAAELEQQRAGLERAQRRAVELAVKEAQEECESEGVVSLELALADERGRLQEESQRSWQKGRRSLLAAAHREWTTAQEAVTRAEVQRAKREWEEGRKEEVKVAVEEALSRAWQRYEGELVRREAARERMATEVQQLEERVASLMRGEGSAPRVEAGTQTVARCGVDTAAVVRELLQQTMAALGRDVRALLQEMVEASAAHCQQEALTASRASAREVQSYYLQCLHQLLNGEKGGLLEAESNARPSWRGEDGRGRGTAAPARRTEQRTLAGRKAGQATQELARTGSSRPKTSEAPPTTAAVRRPADPALAAGGSGVKRHLPSGARTAARTQKKPPASHRI